MKDTYTPAEVKCTKCFRTRDKHYGPFSNCNKYNDDQFTPEPVSPEPKPTEVFAKAQIDSEEPDWEKISKMIPLEDTKQNPAWRGAWMEGEMVGYAKCMRNKVADLLSERDQLKVQIAQEQFDRDAQVDVTRNVLAERDNLQAELEQLRKDNEELISALKNVLGHVIECQDRQKETGNYVMSMGSARTVLEYFIKKHSA